MASKPKRSLQKENDLQGKEMVKVKKRITKSKLRKTLAKLQELEPKCLENIKKCVDGEEVDKTSVDVSKWVIQQLQAVAKSAIQEETDYNNLRWKGDSIQAKEMEEAEELEAANS